MFSPGILKTSLPRIDDKNFKFQGFQLACPHTVQFHLWCATGEVFTIKEDNIPLLWNKILNSTLKVCIYMHVYRVLFSGARAIEQPHHPTSHILNIPFNFNSILYTIYDMLLFTDLCQKNTSFRYMHNAKLCVLITIIGN